MQAMVGCGGVCMSPRFHFQIRISRTHLGRKHEHGSWVCAALGAHLPPFPMVATSQGIRPARTRDASARTSYLTKGGVCRADSQRGVVRDVPAGNTRNTSSAHLMLVSDLDLTMVDHKDSSNSALLRFNNLWSAEYAHNSLLVFSSGRSPEKYKELRQQVPLLTPGIGIFSVGTEILYGSSLEPDKGWVSYLNDDWNRAVVVEEAKRFPHLQFQDESEQRPHKVSFRVTKQDAQDTIKTLTLRLQDRGLKVKLIYSHGIDLDVLPQGAGKGEALAYLMQKMRAEGWHPQKTLVCGDSGNDIELFEVKGVNGVLVGNAMPELIQWYEEHGKDNEKLYRATERCAGGIVQALQHFSLGPHLAPLDRMGPNGVEPSPLKPTGKPTLHGAAQREVVEFNTLFEKWMNGDVPNTDRTFQRLKDVVASGATMVYPWGVEQSLIESVSSARSKHGVTKDKKFHTWIDCIQEQKLADGILLVTWHSWQTSSGDERKGYFATAIFREKAGTPNGVEWLRVHETLRKS